MLMFLVFKCSLCNYCMTFSRRGVIIIKGDSVLFFLNLGPIFTSFCVLLIHTFQKLWNCSRRSLQHLCNGCNIMPLGNSNKIKVKSTESRKLFGKLKNLLQVDSGESELERGVWSTSREAASKNLFQKSWLTI